MIALTLQPTPAVAHREDDPDGSLLRDVFARLARGDMDALADAWDACSQDVYGLALWRLRSPADAADAVQEVFVRLAQQRASLGAVREPRAFVLTIARRVAVDRARRRAVRQGSDLDEARLVEADAMSAETRLDSERASRMLSALPDAQREAVYLRHFAGCSFAEIGTISGVPTFTAASRYRLGIERLRKLMGVTT